MDTMVCAWAEPAKAPASTVAPTKRIERLIRLSRGESYRLILHLFRRLGAALHCSCVGSRPAAAPLPVVPVDLKGHSFLKENMGFGRDLCVFLFRVCGC